MPEPAAERSPDEDLIEATIRRVAEAQAARESAAPAAESEPEPDDDESPLAPPELDPDPALAPLNLVRPATAPSVDEDAIQAAIRRVAEAKAAREQEESAEPQPEPAPEPPPEPLRPSSRKSMAQEAPAAAPAPPAPVEDDWRQAIAALERRLGEHDDLLRGIASRLDALAAGLPPAGVAPLQPASRDWEDEEDEGPTPAPMPFSMPPRPAILRDVSSEAPPSILRDRPADEPPPARPAAAPDIDTRPLPEPLPPIQPDSRRGLDLLPRTYRITVEDKRRGVDLVPLHRALLAMDGVRDMSLLSYNNGVALVSLETVSDIDPEALRRAVSRAMSREARVETHNERTLVVKLAED